MVASDLTGLDALRAFVSRDGANSSPPATPAGIADDLPPFEALVSELAAGGHGVVLVMGKGGVGKTTIAVEAAFGLARLGHPVHLSTTDPAGDPAGIVGAQLPPGLTVSRIDPEVEVRRYTRRKLEEARRLGPDALLPARGGSPLAVHARRSQSSIAFSRLLSEVRYRLPSCSTPRLPGIR